MAGLISGSLRIKHGRIGILLSLGQHSPDDIHQSALDALKSLLLGLTFG